MFCLPRYGMRKLRRKMFYSIGPGSLTLTCNIIRSMHFCSGTVGQSAQLGLQHRAIFTVTWEPNRTEQEHKEAQAKNVLYIISQRVVYAAHGSPFRVSHFIHLPTTAASSVLTNTNLVHFKDTLIMELFSRLKYWL